MKRIIVLFVFALTTFCARAQAPNWLWAAKAGGTGWEAGCSIAVDGSGNSYITGRFGSSSISFGNTTLSNLGSDDIFIVKYDPQGNVLWAKMAGGTAGDVGNGIAVDGSGNIYITGQYTSSSISFDNIVLTSTGGADVFTAKYDPSGNVLWAKSAGGSGGDYGKGIALDGSGNIYVTGEFSNSISFGSTVVTHPTGQAGFIVKYDPSGNVAWAKNTGGSSGFGIAADGNGNSYVTGWDGLNVFVIRYDAQGNLLWTQNGTGSGFQIGRSIAVDGSGNCYVTGFFQSDSISFGGTVLPSIGLDDVFVVKYDPSGNVLWAKSAGGIGSDDAFGIAVDGSGNCYVTGRFSNPGISFGGTTLSNAGNQDIFIAKYGPSGNLYWAKGVGGPGEDWGNAVAADGSGNCYLTGYFRSNSISFGNTILANSNAGQEMFAAKIDSGCIAPQPDTITGNNTPCSGSAQTYSIAAVAGATSYSWTLPAGWTGTSTANTITATAGTSGGVISVASVNACGISPAQVFTVPSVLPLPSPVITQSGNVLSAGGSFSSYQWYLNGNLITGAASSAHTALQGGNYYVVVADGNGCQGQSNTIGFVVNVENVLPEMEVLMAPNPVKEMLFLSCRKTIGVICIYDALGRKILEQNIIHHKAEIDVSFLVTGIYYLKTEHQKHGVRFIKE